MILGHSSESRPTRDVAYRMGSIAIEESSLRVNESLGRMGAAHGEQGKLSAIAAHPLGIRPSGNALTSSTNLRTSIGYFNILPDDCLVLFLEWLDATSLLALGSTCRALFAFTSNEELWRSLFITSPPDDFTWRGSWKATVLRSSEFAHPSIDCSNLFSDALHRPFFCAQISLDPYQKEIPAHNRIARMANISASEFSEKWTDTPFILTGVVKQWPVFEEWSEPALLKEHGNTVFRAEAVDWPLRTYIDYMNNNSDESPLYLFDRDFVHKMNLQVGHDRAYWPPDCFGEDLFSLLGDRRPDSRWLIVGPKRSGSTFHKDPNATSAWNAVIKGSKYWIMFPPSTLPPGVFMSADQSEVTSPLSIAEWLLTFHEEARQTPGCIEGVCHAGEVLHVPSGWWHLVVNLDSAVAITQNFIPQAHLTSAVKFLKDKPDQVSGFSREVKDPYSLFMDKLGQHHPELLEVLEASTNRKRRWEEMVEETPEETNGATGGFSFGFGDDDELEEIP